MVWFPCYSKDDDNDTNSTASLLKKRSHRYQKWLNLCAIFLLVVSIVFMFCSIILMKFYQVEKLNFWSELFLVTPAYIILLGFYIFIIGFFGITVSGLENRCLLVFYAVLQIICFLAQLGTIISSLELRKVLAEAAASHTNVNFDLNRYGIEIYITAKWDAMQRYLHCCGGNNYLVGYKDYRSTPLGANFSVPDSCCFEETPGCGYHMFHRSDVEIANHIFVHGCLTLLKDQLFYEVMPIMIAYAIIGVVSAVVELASVALAAAYVAQISRKRLREKQQSWVSRNQLATQDKIQYATEDYEGMF
jgi:hypothetical protein